MAGKGDAVRSGWYTDEARANYDRIFGKKKRVRGPRKATPSEITEIADYLRGSCRTMSEGIEAVLGDKQIDEDDAAVRVQDVGEIELCDGCGWWCETSEMHDGVCDDCAPDTCPECGEEESECTCDEEDDED
jgi:hypothetical protein